MVWVSAYVHPINNYYANKAIVNISAKVQGKWVKLVPIKLHIKIYVTKRTDKAQGDKLLHVFIQNAHTARQVYNKQ